MKKKTKIELFFFVDALGWEVVKEYGFLKKICPHQSLCDTIFGFSSTCDPSIITGLLPYEHEHFSFFTLKKNKKSNLNKINFLNIFSHKIFQRPRVRNQFNKLSAKILKFEGYFNLYSMAFKKLKFFDYTETRNIYKKNGINGGQKNIFDIYNENNTPYFLYNWKQNFEFNYKTLISNIQNKKIDMAYFMFFELDAVMHQVGTKDKQVINTLKKTEEQIEKIYKEAKLFYDDVHIHVFSDHGMTNITEHCSLMEDFEKLNGSFGIDYVAVWDSTMARFWFFNEEFKAKAIKLLENQKQGSILSENTLKKWGCNFRENIYGETFFLLNPGVLMHPSDMSIKAIKGAHGYDPEDKDSSASWLSNINHSNKEKPQQIHEIFKVMKNI